MSEEQIRAESGPHWLSVGWLRRFFITITAALLSSGMIYYYRCVLLPIRQRVVHGGGNTEGNWSDLYSAWVGTRELLWRGRNPYSAEVTREIQLGFYGVVVDPADPHHLKNPQAFVYPLYVVFLFAPFEHFSFNSVRTGYCVLMFLLTAFSFLLWLYALRVRLRPWSVLLGILAVMSSYAVLDGLGL